MICWHLIPGYIFFFKVNVSTSFLWGLLINSAVVGSSNTVINKPYKVYLNRVKFLLTSLQTPSDTFSLKIPAWDQLQRFFIQFTLIPFNGNTEIHLSPSVFSFCTFMGQWNTHFIPVNDEEAMQKSAVRSLRHFTFQSVNDLAVTCRRAGWKTTLESSDCFVLLANACRH